MIYGSLTSRTPAKSYPQQQVPKIWDPVSYPVLEDVCQVVPTTGHTRNGSYPQQGVPETRTLFQEYQY